MLAASRSSPAVLCLFALMITATTTLATQPDAHQPNENKFPVRPVKVIVPFGAGGGSDTFVRILQKAIEEENLFSQPLIVINVPGAGGTIGSRQVLEAEPDGYTILCLHEGILTAKYAGSAEYGPEAFAAIAATGEVGSVVAVADNSDYAILDELMDAAASRPDQIVFSANIGAPSHFTGLMLETAKPGARFRYTQTGGGAKRFAALSGGHIDVSSFSLAEYMQFKSAGLRALAFCGPERHPSIPEIPTARELGYDVISSNMQFWWAPKGTPPERLDVLSGVLLQAMQSKQVRTRLAEIHTDPVFLEGSALQDSLADREKRISSVASRETQALPNFPALLLSIVGILACVASVQSFLERRTRSDAPKTNTQFDPNESYRTRPGLAAIAIVLTIAYVMVMQKNWMDFRLATILFIASVGMTLVKLELKRLPILAAIAVSLSFGLHALFTNLFVIDLP